MITWTAVPTTSIRQVKDYLALDIETTGLSPDSDRIIELGMIRVEDGEIVNQASTLIDPGVPLSERVEQLTGIRQEDLEGALGYDGIAPSIAKLMIGSVVLAEATTLEFVSAMLNRQGFEGEIRYINLPRFVRTVLPDLPDYRLETLMDYFGLDWSEQVRVLSDSEARHQVLQRCCALPDADTPVARFSRRTAAVRRRWKRMLLPEVLEVEDYFFIGGAVLCLIAALILMPSLASLLLLGAALILAPIPIVRTWLADWKVEGRNIVFLALAVALVGLLLKPGGWKFLFERKDVDAPPPTFISLAWDTPGDYGEERTLPGIKEEDEALRYVVFKMPEGLYRVLNNSAATAQIGIFSDEDELEPAASHDAIIGQSANALTVLSNKNKELALEENQYVILSQDAENVIFQYLGEIPTEEPTENSVGQAQGDKPEIIAYVNGTEVRLRKSASVSAFIMGTFDTGKEVKVLGTVGDWTEVEVDDQRGFIYSKYLTDTKPVTSD